MGALAEVKTSSEPTYKREENNTERLLRLSEEAARGKTVEVTDFSDEGLFRLFSRK